MLCKLCDLLSQVVCPSYVCSIQHLGLSWVRKFSYTRVRKKIDTFALMNYNYVKKNRIYLDDEENDLKESRFEIPEVENYDVVSSSLPLDDPNF